MAKCAFITGASNGIGKGIALKLAEDGYDVAFTYASNLKAAEAVKAQIEGFGRRAFFYQPISARPTRRSAWSIWPTATSARSTR